MGLLSHTGALRGLDCEKNERIRNREMCIRASYAAVRFNAHGSADGIRRPLDTQCPFLFPENTLGIWEDLNTLNIFHHSIWSFDPKHYEQCHGRRRHSD